MTHLQPSPHPHSFPYCCLRWTNPVVVMVKDMVSHPFSSSGSLSGCTTGHVCFLFPHTYFYSLSLSAQSRTNRSPVSCSCWSLLAAIPHGCRPLFWGSWHGVDAQTGQTGLSYCLTSPSIPLCLSFPHTHMCRLEPAMEALLQGFN